MFRSNPFFVLRRLIGSVFLPGTRFLIHLPHQFNLTGTPGLVEPGFGWAIETQEGEPALAGNRLDPVRFLAGRRLRAEVEIDRPIFVLDHLVAGVVLAGVRLAGLEFGASLRVIDHHGNELQGGRILGQVQLVVLAAVKGIAVCVQVAPGVLRPCADQLHRHRRRVDGGHVKGVNPCIQMAAAHALVFEELIVPADEASFPVAAFIKEFRLIAFVPEDRPRGGVGYRNRLGQNLLHAGVGGKGLALLDADGGEESA